MSEVDTNEIHQAYQRVLKDKEILENECYLMKIEMDRMSRLLPNFGHSRSISNASSINNDEDFGYSSSRNTLDLKKGASSLTPPTSERQDGSETYTHRTTESTLKSSKRP